MADQDTTRPAEPPPTSMARLRTLRDKTEAASYAEVLKNALRLYEALIKEAEQVTIRLFAGRAASWWIFKGFSLKVMAGIE